MSTQKFRDLVHYVCWKCEDPTQLGATKLNKIAWFVDTLAYRRDGAAVTGETYIKRQYGPVPKSILPTLARLRQEGKLVQRDAHVEFQPREYIALTQPDTATFSEKEMHLIDAVIDDICKNHTAGSISSVSHDQIWDAANIGEEIPIYAVLAAAQGEITDTDIAWADAIVDTVMARRRDAA